MLFQVFWLILLKLSSFAATWRWRERPTDPSVQQPHAEQRCVSCPLSSSDNSVSGHAHVLFSHQTSHAGIVAAFSALLVAADPNLQRLHVLGIVIHSRNTRFQDAAVDSMAPLLVPVTQRGTEIMKCWCRPCTCSVAPGDAHLCCLLLGGVQSRAPHIAALQSDLGGVQQKTCLLWK